MPAIHCPHCGEVLDDAGRDHALLARWTGYKAGLAGVVMRDCPYELDGHVEQWEIGWRVGVQAADMHAVGGA